MLSRMVPGRREGRQRSEAVTGGSNPMQQEQDQNNDENHSDQAAGTVPAPVIAPSRERADQEKNENDDEDGGKHRGLPGRGELTNAANATAVPASFNVTRCVNPGRAVPDAPDAAVAVLGHE